MQYVCDRRPLVERTFLDVQSKCLTPAGRQSGEDRADAVHSISLPLVSELPEAGIALPLRVHGRLLPIDGALLVHSLLLSIDWLLQMGCLLQAACTIEPVWAATAARGGGSAI